MLPLDVGWDVNFFTDAAARKAAVLSDTHAGGFVDDDRLRRNLLASQPACLNCFAPLDDHPEVVAQWIHATIPGLPDDLEVEGSIQYEWAPDRREHFGGGSAFDAFITYTCSLGRGFVGVETKYSEDLERSAPKRVRDVYIDYTRSSTWWRQGAEHVVRAKRLRQFWLNLILGESLAAHPDSGFELGDVVVLSCQSDQACFDAAVDVANQRSIYDPAPGDVGLHWSSYEDVLGAAASTPALDEWCETFRRRYLDFQPVLDLLTPDDPRRRPQDRRGDAWGELTAAANLASAIAERVLADGSVLQQALEAGPEPSSIAGLEVAARHLREASHLLKAVRIGASEATRVTR